MSHYFLVGTVIVRILVYFVTVVNLQSNKHSNSLQVDKHTLGIPAACASLSTDLTDTSCPRSTCQFSLL